MADAMKTTNEIAADLGLTRAGVWHRINQLGIEPAKKVGGAAMFSADQVRTIAAAGDKKQTPARRG